MRADRVWIAGIVLALGVAAYAAEPPESPSMVPEYINYQGRLVDPDGVPYSNVTHTVELRLYDNAGGGTVLWGERYSVKTQDGYFSILLGSGGTTVEGAPDVALWQVLWKEGGGGSDSFFMAMTVLTDASGEDLTTPVEATPRQQFVTSPFAVRALQSRFAGGARDEFRAEAGINTPSITSTGDVVVTQSMRISGSGKRVYTSHIQANDGDNLDIVGADGNNVDITSGGGTVRVGYGEPPGSRPLQADTVQVGYTSGTGGTTTRVYGNYISVSAREGQSVGINAKNGTVNLGYTFGIPAYGASHMTIGHTSTDMNIQSDNLKVNSYPLFAFEKVTVNVSNGYGTMQAGAIDVTKYDEMVVGFSMSVVGYSVRSIYMNSQGMVSVWVEPRTGSVQVTARVLGIRKGLTSGFAY